MKRLYGVVLAAVLLSGCMKASFTQFSEQVYAPTPPGVDIPVLETHTVGRTYEIIGEVKVVWGKPAERMRALRAKAREIGADALIDLHIREDTVVVTAKAIKWRD